MISRLITIRNSIKNNKILMNILLYSSLVLFSAYIFSIGMFSGRANYNFVCIGIFAVMACFMLFYSIISCKPKIDLLVILLINLIISFLLSNLVNLSFVSFPKSVILQCFSALIFYYFFRCFDNKHRDLFFFLIVLGGLLFFFFYVYHYRQEIFTFNFDNRLGSFFDNENEVGKEFGYFAIISFSCHLFITGKHKSLVAILLAISSLFFVFGILTTGSISNLLTYFLVIVITCLFKLKNLKQRFFFLGIVIGLIGIFILLLQLPMFSYFKERIEKMFKTFFNGGAGGDSSSNLRLYALVQYIKLFFLKPLFGFGYGQGKAYTAYNLVAHSSVAELLTCVGLFGFLSFELLLFLPLKKTYKKNNIIFCTFLYLTIFQLFISSTYHSKIEYILIPIGFAYFSDQLSIRSFIQNKKKLLSEDNKLICCDNYFEVDI